MFVCFNAYTFIFRSEILRVGSGDTFFTALANPTFSL